MRTPFREPESHVVGSRAFPWLALLLLVGAVYFFWVLPYQMGRQPVRVEFHDR